MPVSSNRSAGSRRPRRHRPSASRPRRRGSRGLSAPAEPAPPDSAAPSPAFRPAGQGRAASAGEGHPEQAERDGEGAERIKQAENKLAHREITPLQGKFQTVVCAKRKFSRQKNRIFTAECCTLQGKMCYTTSIRGKFCPFAGRTGRGSLSYNQRIIGPVAGQEAILIEPRKIHQSGAKREPQPSVGRQVNVNNSRRDPAPSGKPPRSRRRRAGTPCCGSWAAPSRC